LKERLDFSNKEVALGEEGPDLKLICGSTFTENTAGKID